MDFRMGMFFILLVATVLMLMIAYLSYRKRKQNEGKYGALAMLAASFYSFGYAFELISVHLDQAKFWLKVQYIGIPFITTFWLLIVISYTGHHFFLKKKVLPFLFAIPILTFIMYFTNDSHYLYYRDLLFDPGLSEPSTFIFSKGPFYWVHTAYVYLEAAVGMGMFVRMYAKAVPIVRKQVLMLIFGASAPWLCNIVYLLSADGNSLDLTPFGFLVTGSIYIWGIYRLNMLRLVPVAYQQVFETMQDGVIILDYDHNLSHVNEAAKGIFEELKAWDGQTQSIAALFASNPQLLAKIVDGEHSESRLSLHKEGETSHYHVKISHIYDKSQNFLGKVLIFSDVTQVVRYQEELLANANQLEELHAFKDKAFAIVTHDIRDPLAMLVNLTDIIEGDLMDAGKEESRIFQEINKKVKDTYWLVENLLNWFRSQRGKINFHPLVWELEPIVRQSAKAMHPRITMKDIQMTVAVQGGTNVYADKDMLGMILRNLLFNAVKYTEAGGHIHVHARRNGTSVTVSVQDSGAGVGREVGKSLFDEMQQGSEPGTEGESGTGLGLYLCGKFVRLHGGDIWYEARPGEGSTFFFTLPTHEAAAGLQRTWKEVDAE
ncbi:PAS domain S-box protein [Xylanibacillus composti]|uniref:histidine kinase n=1 Tax=Xylanibacillus composti TaxID=1572762 RepID=A0A8J4H4D8_9BACL|nr:histidine kinase N-terminal 7TM domain-containing protein [Xylanibacillus composti]MDT9726853.1 PAS domain S-box protein [Xylanibacillus composti]GIQ70649.1 two-component sensor histidine kinase [Xylanibacillus composti]